MPQEALEFFLKVFTLRKNKNALEAKLESRCKVLQQRGLCRKTSRWGS